MNLKRATKKSVSALTALWLVGLSAGYADTPTAEQARELVEKAAEAYGGKDVWEEKSVLIVHETQTRYEDEGSSNVRLVHYLETRGRKYRLERDGEEGQQVFGWDGQRFWAVADGKPGDVDLLREARRVISDAFYRFSLPFILTEADPGYVGTDTVDGVKTEVVKISYPENPTSRYWEAAKDSPDQHPSHENSRPSAEAHHGDGHHSGDQIYYFHFDKGYRIVKVYFSHHGDGSFESLYPGDYREVDGILMDHSRTLLRPDGERHYDTEFTRIEFSKDSEDNQAELFKKPYS